MWTNQKISRVGVFVALSFLFSYLEFLIPLPFAFPGMKLGLANIVILVPLYLWGGKMAFLISMIRVVLVSITFGNMTYLIFSMAGALLSLLVMIGLKRWKAVSIVGVSTMGGVFHNVGQLVIAMAMVNSTGLLYYFPPLLIAGSIAGYVMGLISMKVLNHIHKKSSKTERSDKEYLWTNRER